MHITFEDKKEKRVFQALLIFGLLTLSINIIKIFLVKPTEQYILLSIEMVLGIAVIFAPFIFTRWTKLIFPKILRIYYWFFIWISVFLGTGLRLIVIIPFWDKILHAVSPILLTAIGYAIIGYYLKNNSFSSVNPWLFIIMGFSFAGLCGVFWEFWEFICDSIGNLNLQRYMSEAGKPYIGRAALMDTMGDLFTNTLGSLILTIYSYIKRNDSLYFEKFSFKKIT